MCGICGFLDLNNRRIQKERIYPMLEKIRHRGPDGFDAVDLGSLALGFCRLSFVDLQGGMQPISNEDDSLYMVCNGEVFNYKELRKAMEEKGHHFKTNTDVEVILHLYEEYGEEFINCLNGQFAIALYDKSMGCLYLVRDHMGIAPLFYTVVDGQLVFGSEIKAILEYPGVERKINLAAIDQVLNFPGIVSPVTCFKGIHSLESGHFLRIMSDGSMENHEYWDLCYNVTDEDLGEEYYIQGIRERLIHAIDIRLQADVPIGFYISGGLDSSVIACMIHEYISEKHDSFSAEIEGDDYSEKKYQQIICEQINASHHSVTIRNEELWKYMPEVVYHTETPLRESYDVAAYLLSGLVGETDVRAVLTGQGSDEFFNGYVGYASDFFRKMKKGSISPEEQEINERLWGDPTFRYERNHVSLYETNKRLYSEAARAQLESFSALKISPIDVSKVQGLGTQRRRSYIDSKLRLADHLLGDHGDRMVFAHSVEGRHPFLDKDLIEFVIRIPEKYKLRGVEEKYILKKVAEGLVPEEIIKRKKFAFSTPGMSHMLKNSPDIAEQYLCEEKITAQGIFDYERVKELKEQYMQPDFDLKGAYELDYLQIILTVTMLCDRFGLTL